MVWRVPQPLSKCQSLILPYQQGICSVFIFLLLNNKIRAPSPLQKPIFPQLLFKHFKYINFKLFKGATNPRHT